MKAFAGASLVVAANAAEAPLANLALTWKDCGGLAKINTVTPSTIPLGAKTTITGSGTSPVKVTAGRFDATVKAGWIPLATCSGALGPAKTCTLPLGAGSLTLNAIPLPIGPGAASISLDVQLAASLPAQLAATTTHATALNTANQKVVCIDIYLKNGMSDEIPTVGSKGIWDDIKAIICKALESGLATHEVETLVCTKLKYSLEVTACDKAVEFLVSKIESKELKCAAEVVV